MLSIRNPQKTHLVLAMPHSSSTALARALVHITGENGTHEPYSNGIIKKCLPDEYKDNFDNLKELPLIKEMITPDNPDKNLDSHLTIIKDIIQKTDIPIIFLTASPCSIIVSELSRAVKKGVKLEFPNDTNTSKYKQFHIIICKVLERCTRERQRDLNILNHLKEFAQQYHKQIVEISQNDLRINPVRTVNKIATAWGYKPLENNVVPLAPVQYVSAGGDINTAPEKAYYHIMTAPCDIQDPHKQEYLYKQGDIIDTGLKPEQLAQNRFIQTDPPTINALTDKLYNAFKKTMIGYFDTTETETETHHLQQTVKNFVTQCVNAENPETFDTFFPELHFKKLESV